MEGRRTMRASVESLRARTHFSEPSGGAASSPPSSSPPTTDYDDLHFDSLSVGLSPLGSGRSSLTVSPQRGAVGASRVSPTAPGSSAPHPNSNSNAADNAPRDNTSGVEERKRAQRGGRMRSESFGRGGEEAKRRMGASGARRSSLASNSLLRASPDGRMAGGGGGLVRSISPSAASSASSSSASVTLVSPRRKRLPRLTQKNSVGSVGGGGDRNGKRSERAGAHGSGGSGGSSQHGRTKSASVILSNVKNALLAVSGKQVDDGMKEELIRRGDRMGSDDSDILLSPMIRSSGGNANISRGGSDPEFDFYFAQEGNMEGMEEPPIPISGLRDGLDAVGNMLPSRKRVPGFFIFYLVALFVLNVVVFALRIVRSSSAAPPSELKPPEMLLQVAWVVLLDGITIAFMIIWILLRLVMVLLEKLSSRFSFVQNMYYFLYPYEAPFRTFAWALLLLLVYPLIFNRLVLEEDPSDSLQLVRETFANFLYSAVMVGILYTFRVVALSVIEGAFYNELDEMVSESCTHERWLICLEEGFGTAEAALLSSKLSQRKISELLSPGLRSIAGVAELQGRANVDAAVAEMCSAIIAAYSRGGEVLSIAEFEAVLDYEAVEVFEKFDVDGDGEVSLRDLDRAIKLIYYERKRALMKIKSAKTRLDIAGNLLSFGLALVGCIVTMVIFSVPMLTFVLPIAIGLFIVVFVFQQLLRDLIAGILLLYYERPFEVGDSIRCGRDERALQVEELGLLMTRCSAADGTAVFVQNTQLQKRVVNLSLGSRIALELDFAVHASTTTEQMASLVRKLERYMKRSGVWAHKFVLSAEGWSVHADVIPMKLVVSHKTGGRWSEEMKWQAPKTALVFELQKLAKTLRIKLCAAQWVGGDRKKKRN